MTDCYTLLPTLCFSRFGLDPETPASDYEIHLIRTQDPAYLPPDSEAWPLYYRVVVEAIQQIPGAFEAVRAAVAELAANPTPSTKSHRHRTNPNHSKPLNGSLLLQTLPRKQ